MKKQKLSFVLNLLLVMFITMALYLITYSYILSSRLSDLSSNIYRHPYIVTNEIKEITNNLNNIVNAADDLRNDEKKSKENVIENITTYENSISHSFSLVEERFSGDKDLVFSAEILFEDYKNALRKNLKQRVESIGHEDIQSEEVILEKLRTSINNLYRISSGNASAFIGKIEEEKNKIILPFFSFIVITLVYGALFVLVIYRMVRKPIKKVTDRLERIFEDNPEEEFSAEGKSEIEILVYTIEYLERMRVKLKSEIGTRRITEDKLKNLNEELMKSLTSKDRLFTIISHDLINPFQSIVGFSSLLLDNFKDIPETEKLEMLGNIRQSAVNQHALLQNLLNWSRSQLGELTIKKEFVNVKNLVSELFKGQSITAREKNISLISELNEECYVYSDKNVLSVILNNLIQNAIKFSYAGSNIFLNCREEEYYRTIVVRDSGTGMRRETAENLFVRDRYDSEPGTIGEKGSGLGLIICREFMEKQNGKIWAESEPGIGSKFFISFPKEIFTKSRIKFE